MDICVRTLFSKYDVCTRFNTNIFLSHWNKLRNLTQMFGTHIALRIYFITPPFCPIYHAFCHTCPLLGFFFLVSHARAPLLAPYLRAGHFCPILAKKNIALMFWTKKYSFRDVEKRFRDSRMQGVRTIRPSSAHLWGFWTFWAAKIGYFRRK